MGKSAFTIIELLGVMILIAMVFAISIPLFAKFSQSMNLDIATRTAVSVLRTARGMAIGDNKKYYVVFDNEKTPNEFFIYDGTEIVEQVFKTPVNSFFFKGDDDASYPPEDAVEFTATVTVDGHEYEAVACFTQTGSLDDNADRSLYLADGNSVKTPTRCNRITVNHATGKTDIEKCVDIIE